MPNCVLLQRIAQLGSSLQATLSNHVRRNIITNYLRRCNVELEIVQNFQHRGSGRCETDPLQARLCLSF